jgi:ATP-binding cassette subfamily B protein
MFVITNTLGLILALSLSGTMGASLEVVFITFSYYSTATRVMWEFNRIYRSPGRRAHRCGAVRRPAARSAVGRRCGDGRGAVAGRLRCGVARGVLPVLAVAASCCSTVSPCQSRPGAKIGLVGRSGGGKTTLTRLLLRFSDIESGAILIGGQSIARVPQASLRNLIAYVPQDPSMFHRSIADNIRVGRPDATDADVRRAAGTRARRRIHRCPAGRATRRWSASVG